MTLVAGVDSSTQRDQGRGPRRRDRRARRGPGRAAPSDAATEVDGPGGWWAAFETAPRRPAARTSPRSPSAASSTAWSCLDADRRGGPPALLWNDTQSGGHAATLVDRARRRGGVGRRGGSRAGGQLHRHQAARGCAATSRTSRPPRRSSCPHDWLTWRLDRRGSSPTGATPPAPATGRRRPARTGRPAQLASGRDRVDCRRVLGPHEPAGETARRRARPGHRRQHGCRARASGCGPGDVVVSIGTSGTVFAVQRPADGRRHRHRRRLRRRHRPLPPAGLHAERARGPVAVARLLGVDLAELRRAGAGRAAGRRRADPAPLPRR